MVIKYAEDNETTIRNIYIVTVNDSKDRAIDDYFASQPEPKSKVVWKNNGRKYDKTNS